MPDESSIRTVSKFIMTTKKAPHQVHFPYQHPTFGLKNRPAPVSAWQDTIYYLWWLHLRLNADYLACCEAGGVGKLAGLYADFGDVRDDCFKAWWQGKGVFLFSEPRADDSMRLLEEGEIALSRRESLTINIPLNLPRGFVDQKVKDILDQHFKRGRGQQFARESRARYKFNGQPNIEAIKTSLKVYQYRQEHPELKLWEIGRDLKLVPLPKPSKPNIGEKNVLTATVSRYLRRATIAINATVQGQFPRLTSSTPKRAEI